MTGFKFKTLIPITGKRTKDMKENQSPRNICKVNEFIYIQYEHSNAAQKSLQEEDVAFIWSREKQTHRAAGQQNKTHMALC